MQGPALKEQLQFILDEQPNVIFCDGPMSYMLGYRYSKKNLQKSIRNLGKIIRETNVKKLVVEHHLLRDLQWKKRIKNVIRWPRKRR